MYYFNNYASPVGRLTIASNEKSIVGLWLYNQRYYMDVLQGKEYQEKETEVIKQAEKWLDMYFNHEKPAIEVLPIEFVGSDFRIRVWKKLIQIPYGNVITYGDIAKEIAKEMGISIMSAQAVGGAVGRNPISIIVPCHRVIGANGNLTGYSAGVEIKAKLLKFEGTTLPNLYIR